jgi:hypothetical protein
VLCPLNGSAYPVVSCLKITVDLIHIAHYAVDEDEKKFLFTGDIYDDNIFIADFISHYVNVITKVLISNLIHNQRFFLQNIFHSSFMCHLTCRYCTWTMHFLR